MTLSVIRLSCALHPKSPYAFSAGATFPESGAPPLPANSAFALRYILRLSSCRLTEGFIMPPLPHLAVEEFKLSMAPLLQRHYSPSSLLRATPPSCCLQPLSRVRSYRADLLRRFLSGAYRTSPVSVVSLSPCRRQ